MFFETWTASSWRMRGGVLLCSATLTVDILWSGRLSLSFSRLWWTRDASELSRVDCLPRVEVAHDLNVDAREDQKVASGKSGGSPGTAAQIMQHPSSIEDHSKTLGRSAAACE